jgi:xanthine dehydrogenase YagS FAD-binding subunit
MVPFEYDRPTEKEKVIDALSHSNRTKILAGGTNLVDLMKNGVEQPEYLVDINRLDLTAIGQIADGGVRLGALAHNSDTANHPLIRERYPLLSQAILSGASPQLRNMATNGGNLLQRTRCYYFTDPGFPQCNKRLPGSGCGAIDGFNRIHAILGSSNQCVATHPSDMCVALAALDAKVRVQSSKGVRTIEFSKFHRLPGNTPNLDTNLEPDELILSIDLPPGGFARHSHYLKIRDRASYAFALVSVAAALEMDGDKIQRARIALGGVAHKPWRATEVENELVGRRAEPALFELAARLSVHDARPLNHNMFKVELVPHAIVRALSLAGGVA